MNFALNLPVNGVSFGQTSVAILREIYKAGYAPALFPIGNPDLSAYNQDNDFNLWLQSCVNKAYKYHKRTTPILKLWHLNQSLDSFSKEQALFTFHETDQTTEEENNAIQNQSHIFVSSKYTKEVFENGGATNVEYCPLGFDSHSFKKTDKKYLSDKYINFSLSGKLEDRKNTLRILKLWAKKFGNDRSYFLNCLIFNPFIPPQEQEGMIMQALEGKRYWNIKFHPSLRTNAEVNDFINNTQIELCGLSGCEGFNLPLLNALCMGKQAVVLNAHVHKDFCNEENSILVQPTGLRQAVDNKFFIKGAPFNQGNWFDFNDDEVIAAMERAASKANIVNSVGEKLKEEFSFSRTAQTIVNYFKK